MIKLNNFCEIDSNMNIEISLYKILGDPYEKIIINNIADFEKEIEILNTDKPFLILDNTEIV